jgi:YegS/Rv2252/BmrU family lipid kinase
MLADLKTRIIINPAAGKGRGGKPADTVLAALSPHARDLSVKYSEHPDHLRVLAAQAVSEQVKRIISVGGDGTPFEIINGIIAAGGDLDGFEFGMIPAGTGNSFLRDFTEISVENILKSILAGNSRKVDLIEFSYLQEQKEIKQHYLNILGVGLISDILKLTNEKFKFLGSFGYSLAVLVRLFKGMHNEIRLIVDDAEYELKNSALVISNSIYTGGSMKIAPNAQVDDGKVDIIIFDQVGRIDILKIFSKVFNGEHIKHPKVKTLKGSKIEIHPEPNLLLMADGELLGYTPLKLEVLPQKLKILL